MVKELTFDDFKDFLSTNNKVVVDFWAPWCGPCKVVSKSIDDLSKEYADITFAKVNVDDEEVLLSEYSVGSLPTLIFFKDGVDTGGRLIGAQPKPKIKEGIEKNLS